MVLHTPPPHPTLHYSFACLQSSSHVGVLSITPGGAPVLPPAGPSQPPPTHLSSESQLHVAIGPLKCGIETEELEV